MYLSVSKCLDQRVYNQGLKSVVRLTSAGERSNEFEILMLTLFRMGLFEVAHGLGGRQKETPSLKSVTHTLQ